MRYQLVVSPEMSRTIGGFGLVREVLLSVFNYLYLALEEHSADHRHRRDPKHPDVCFWLELTIWDGGRPRGFRFTVDDALAPDRLFLVAAEEV